MKHYSKIITRTLRQAWHKHGQEILTGGAILGTGAAVVSAVKATKKADKLIEAKKEELQADKLTVKETITTTWPCYINTALFTVGSIGCALGGLGYSKGKYASLLTMCAANTNELNRYKKYIDDFIENNDKKSVDDPTKVQVKKEDIVKEKPKHFKNPDVKSEATLDKEFTNREVIIGNNDILFLDPLSGRTFKSTREKVDRAVVELNANLLSWGTVTLNDWYTLIGLRSTRSGDDVGWSRDDRGSNFRIQLRYIPDQVDDHLCYYIEFVDYPEYGYDKTF